MMQIIRSGFVISSYDQLVSLVNDKVDEGGQRFLRVRPGVASHFAKGGALAASCPHTARLAAPPSAMRRRRKAHVPATPVGFLRAVRGIDKNCEGAPPLLHSLS